MSNAVSSIKMHLAISTEHCSLCGRHQSQFLWCTPTLSTENVW